MPTGYLVTLGNNTLDAGDSISGTKSAFTTVNTIGAGSWNWSGVWDANGVYYSNITDTGTYYLASNGNVYFVPTTWLTTSGTASAISPPAYTATDGIVDGTAGADTMALGYADAGGDKITSGNDTIQAGDGNDTVRADFGNDSVSGGNGNDLIYGDSTATPVTGSATSFSWASQGVADEANITNGLTGLSANGNVRVTMSVQQEANFGTATMETTDPLYNYNAASDTSSIFLSGGNLTTGGSNANSQNSATATIDFSSGAAGYSDEVSSVTFGIFDIDDLQGQFIDQVIVTAYDANGNSIPVTVTLGSTTTLTSTTNANGSQTVTSVVNSGGAGASNSQTGYASFSVAGPVSYITIDYNNMDPARGAHGILIGDLQFTSLPASGGNDTLSGDAGNDTIFGQGGNDTLYGGTGNDTLDGGDGNDLLNGSYTGDPDGDRVDGNDAILAGDTGNDDLIYGYGGNDRIYAGNGNDEVYGGTGNDLLQTGLGDDTVYGDDGNDSIYAENGNDTVYGGAGDDVVGASIGNDLVYGGDGNDTINGGGYSNEGDTLFGDAGNDSISGDAGNDTLYGGADDDILVGGTNDDSIYGGTGNDKIVVGDNHGTDVIEGGEDASGLNNDILDLNDLSTTGGTNVTLTGNEAGTYDFNNAAATGTFTEIETFDLTDSADTFDGAAATTNTTVLAGAGNDTITTGSGDDSIIAGAGDDLIDGGAGDDSIDGGTGNDTFAIAETSGADTIVGGENAGDTDTLFFQGATFGAGANVTFTGDESGTYLVDGSSVAGPDATGSFSEIEAIVGTATSDYVNASASTASVTISGEGGFDILTGSSADDVIYGGDGGDLLTGGEGADVLIGDAGNDIITFSEGDTVEGGTGDDTFVAENLGETTNGTITITGGSGGETTGVGDTLQLGSLADLSTLVKISDGIKADGNETFHGSVTMDDGTILNFSEIENIICFTPGTRIATPKGARDIATLRVGDLVVTRDHGLQPIRWIQQRTVPALESFAPIRIRPGVITGQDRDLLVSPQHRMLFQGYRAELLFGESEVLVSAKHMINDKYVTQETGGDVTYIHMMFDEHEVVYAEGAATESFHPGDVGLTAVSDPAREELFALFPALRSNVNGYGQTARRCLKGHETKLLIV